MSSGSSLKLFALAALFVAAPLAADAAVIFGFDVNQSTATQMFTYSGGGPGATLTADANVDFTVQFAGQPVQTFDDAVLDFNGTQVASIPIPGVGDVLYFDGNYTLTDSLSGNVILSADFLRAHVLLLNSSSSAALSASSEEVPAGGLLDYHVGQALQDLADLLGVTTGAEILNLVPVEDVTFSLTNITPPVNAINGFTANSSYSGNAETRVIPEPATVALLGFGGLGVLIRRRRRA